MEFDAEKLFGQNGLLASSLPNYEYRQEQMEMAEKIYTCLTSGIHGIVEAGTGVGKSLAYLVPAIFFAAEENKRVVIAPHTLNLQEQLFLKDIPFLKDTLPFEFTALLFKGRSNYLCLRRYNEYLDSHAQMGLLDNLEKLNLWMQTTPTGDRTDCPHSIPQNLWTEICCEKESCPEELCGYFKSCFYWQLRHRLSKAQIILTNQALLLGDILTDGKVLPKYDAVVIDEAHNLEDIATNAFSVQLSRQKFGAYFRTGSQLLTSLKGSVPEYLLSDLRICLDEVVKEAGQYFNSLQIHVTQPTLTIDETNYHIFANTKLIELLQKTGDLLEQFELEESESQGLCKQFSDFNGNLLIATKMIIEACDPVYVYWAELQNDEVVLQAGPILVADHLAETLFERTSSVILTSATLSTNNNFDYFRQQIGLPDGEELLLGSPFDYSSQALLCVPSQAKNPNHPQYINYTAYLILYVAAMVKGRVLVLFTSYSMMDRVAELILPKLDEQGYALFVQGEDSKQRLLDDFRNTPRSLLFGTNSFWEGVDLPGDTLQAVVITRLPFAVPDRPVIAARLQALEQQGKNSFVSYSLPQAILRLKQGFGRLIRTSQDRGGVIILDGRILSSSYGDQFISSLPSARFSQDLHDLSRLLHGR